MMTTADLPSPALIQTQAQWLAPARAWLLRQAGASQRQTVLDLGCGYGVTIKELEEACPGQIVGLDHNWAALQHGTATWTRAGPACADAVQMPFASQAFDLVLCQLALLWMPLDATLSEIRRVLRTGGTLVAIEPDYGGMIEHPPVMATRNLWIASLERSGADPWVGRKLPGALAELGFQVQVELMSKLTHPAPERFELLRGLSLTKTEQRQLAHIERQAKKLDKTWDQVVHLPFLLITAVLAPDSKTRPSWPNRILGALRG
jgi:SAM-dependent methyltransferase